MMLGTELDLIFNGRLGLGEIYVDSSNAFDLMLAVFIGYMLLEYFPTFYINATDQTIEEVESYRMISTETEL